MNVIGIKLEEALRRPIDFAAQLAADGLAHHRTLLARNGEQVRLRVGEDRLAERVVKIIARPVGGLGWAIARLEVGHAP